MSEESTPSSPVAVVQIVTTHALTRWMERTECRSETRALRMLHQHLARATEVQLAPKFRAIALLEHDLKPARYFSFDRWVFVVSDDGALLTVHTGDAKRWIPMVDPPGRNRKANEPLGNRANKGRRGKK